ncbi:MAG: TonB-dependent receptor [Rhodospirillaceae bacterium]|nr:MAG: TonB-dependent receptor [Rhodospirillaceae bacterium]
MAWAFAAFATTPAFGAATVPASHVPDQITDNPPIEDIVVTAKRLDEARTGIENRTGASTYVIDAAAIAATPGGDNTLLNQVILQTPDVAQDSFGQIHIRGEHNGAQYRLNGIILPEGISVFGQTLDPRLISSMKVITGALPAEYGLRTAGIIDLTTKSGLFAPGGSASIYGGSHGTIEPSFNYGGSAGAFNYFVSGDFLHNNLGIESPDRSSNPRHDATNQYHGFGYFEDIPNDENRVTVVLGTSHGHFQIPDRVGIQPALGLTINGRTAYPSQNLNENQREITHFGILSLQHSVGNLDVQSSLIGRYSSLTFMPDPLGDLLYNGISQQAYKRDVALGFQTDGSYHLGDTHTLRAGFYIQRDRATSLTTSQVLPTDQAGNQIGDTPVSILDNSARTQWIESVYLQDEWKLVPALTVNYGLRYDHFAAYTSGSQFSPRVNMVWQPADDTAIHAGYSRYFSPPPFELVGNVTIAKFSNTTAAAPSSLTDLPKAEQANAFDVGAAQKLFGALTVGIDSYYKKSRNLIDEGQFGAPIILTPFSYYDGKQYGLEFTASYTSGPFSTYGNLAFQSAKGRNITAAQFNFAPDELAYIANHYIDLDHEQRITASAGTSYLWRGTRVSADILVGSGLRATLVSPDGSSVPNGAHLPYYTQVNLGVSHAFDLARLGGLTARLDVINAFDHVYEIRNGTGVGVGAPQYGPRRGFFVGLSKSL